MMGLSRDSKVVGRVVAILLGLVLIAIFFFNGHIGSYFRGIVASIRAPRAAATDFSTFSRDALIERVVTDEAELSRVRYQELLYNLIANENANLRTAVSASPLQKGVTGRVVARPPQTHYDTLLIDSGKSAGVRENDLAVYEGVALGTVISTGDKNALVELFSSPGLQRDVLVGTPQAVAVARGLGGGSFELSAPPSVKVSVGDVVRFPGTESLILGVVSSVTPDSKGSSETVRFASPVSFSSLDFVRVISP